MSDKKVTIAIDFDGVIHRYSKGWHDGTAYDTPMEGAIECIKRLMEQYYVYIFSTRPAAQIQDWFGRHGEQIATEIIKPDQMYWSTKSVLGIANHKLVSFILLDDRAIRFEGSWERAQASIEAVIAGKPIAHDGEASDGYHTFNELYDFRMLYNAHFFNLLAYLHDEHGDVGQYAKPVKSKRHSDGELCFGGGWFVVVAQLPTGQITNHYPMKDWNLFQIDEVEKAPEWDGHSPQDVAKRLRADLERTS